MESYGSTQNENLCRQHGGEIKNFGEAYNYEYLDNCLNLNSDLCNEINGSWKECIPPDCSDLSKPCPTVTCLGYDVCLLKDEKIFQQEKEIQEFQKKIAIVVIIGLIVIGIILIYKLWKNKKNSVLEK